MEIIKIDCSGFETAQAQKIPSRRDAFSYCLDHGQQGDGSTWQIRIGLGSREFPASAESPQLLELDEDYKLVHLPHLPEDQLGNPRFLLGRGTSDGTWLVMWNLVGGGDENCVAYDYSTEGAVEYLAKGRRKNAILGTVLADAPLLHITGPARLKWIKTFADGTKAEFVAEYDGDEWGLSF